MEVLESRDDLGGVEESRGGGEVARSDCGHDGGVVHEEDGDQSYDDH